MTKPKSNNTIKYKKGKGKIKLDKKVMKKIKYLLTKSKSIWDQQ